MSRGGQNRTHGMSRTREYLIWAAMKRRCTSPRATDYARYGGRGITVCESWMSFDGFFADMGFRPSDQHTLERIDNESGYEPGNCRWATKIEQANNKRTSRLVEYRGECMTVANAARAGGAEVRRETAICRIRNGWSVSEAVETPPLFRRASDRTVIREHETSE